MSDTKKELSIGVISFRDIANHPTKRMDAGYHIAKSKGKKAYKKHMGGLLKPNDISGDIFLTPEEATRHNTLTIDILAMDQERKEILS